MMDDTGQSPYQWVKNREGYKVLLRTKYPRFAVEIQDDADDKQIADALKKAAEFLLKGKRKQQSEPLQRVAYLYHGGLHAMDVFDERLNDGGYRFVGDICDEECDDGCSFFCSGSCPFVPMRTADGERIKVHEM